MVVKSARLPKPGETVTGGQFVLAAGGKGANQAVAAARLGAEVAFLAKVGSDMFGDQAIENYKREGIAVDLILRDPTRHTGVALILVDERGENLISVASGANHALTAADVEQGGRADSRGGRGDAAVGDPPGRRSGGRGNRRGRGRSRYPRPGARARCPSGWRTAGEDRLPDAQRDRGGAARGNPCQRRAVGSAGSGQAAGLRRPLRHHHHGRQGLADRSGGRRDLDARPGRGGSRQHRGGRRF